MQKKYRIMRNILIINPIPIGVILYGIAIFVLKVIKNKNKASSWRKKITKIGLMYPILEIMIFMNLSFFIFVIMTFVLTQATNIYIIFLIFYIVFKFLDIYIGIFMISKLEEDDLFTLKKDEYGLGDNN